MEKKEEKKKEEKEAKKQPFHFPAQDGNPAINIKAEGPKEARKLYEKEMGAYNKAVLNNTKTK